MAKLNDTSKGILGDASKKIGSFSESTGGGTPLAKGEKLKDHPEAKRVSQPRDEDGQFTYNSVNGKELKYGPSRGTTVPPFLKGLKLTFCEKGTKLKLEGPDGIKIKLMTIDMSVDQIVANCKRYIESEGGFAGMGEGSSIDKKGRKSKVEKEGAAGQIGVADVSKLSARTQQKIVDAANKYIANNSAQELAPMVHTMFTPGYKVKNDTLNPDGSTTRNTSERYHEWYANQQAAKQPAPAAAAQQPQQQKAQPQAQQTPTSTSTPAPAAASTGTGSATKSGLLGKLKGFMGGLGNSNNNTGNAQPSTSGNNGKISLQGFLAKKNKGV